MAYRPPALPLLIAGNHLLFGRQFVTVRIGNAVLIAGAVSLAAALAMRLIGRLGAVLVPVLGLADPRVLAYSGAILTEALALFAVVLMTWLIARLLDRPSSVAAVLAGASLGFAALCRSNFVLWYPLVTASVYLLVCCALVLAAIFLGAAVVVPAPWWVRLLSSGRSMRALIC